MRIHRSYLALACLAMTIVSCVSAGAGTVAAATAPADSALVGRILLAEDRRDASDRALAEGVQGGDERVRLLARRALARIRDPKFAARDSFPVGAPSVTWPEPAWRIRYRALTAVRSDCGALRAALADASWPVRLRAADLAGAGCASDDAMAAMLRGWADGIPADASRRAAGDVSWHPAAHAIVALARMRPAEARPRLAVLARHSQWQARRYAARAAAVLRDSTLLRALVRDMNDDVKEAAIEGLASVSPADVDLFVQSLGASGPQVVRAAAVALKGTTRADVARAANAAFNQWVGRDNASERDVRVALLEVSGRPASDDRPPAIRHELPAGAVALALGADVRLRVRMSAWTGGGSFVVRLRGDAAPMMAARILALARRGYYDGLTWHRVEHDFVIQGGSPGSSEYVGYSQFLRDELGIVPHARGTVGMSTRGHDTGDAQWFVNLKDNLRLNPDYTIFAEVVEGMDVVDGIMEGDVIERIEVVQG